MSLPQARILVTRGESMTRSAVALAVWDAVDGCIVEVYTGDPTGQ